MQAAVLGAEERARLVDQVHDPQRQGPARRVRHGVERRIDGVLLGVRVKNHPPARSAPMAKVCHTCPWWQKVRGTKPNTGEEIDRWDCAIAFMPLLQVEVASQARQGAAATESFRNGMVRRYVEQQQTLEDRTPRSTRTLQVQKPRAT
jgi:hypothetical protein